MSLPSDARTEPAPLAALLLGFAGLIPFAGGAVALFVTARGPTGDTLLVLPILAYGAVILSFLGGVRWGLAFREESAERQARAFAYSIVPSLVAWVAVALATHHLSAFLLLIGAHAVQGWYDVTTAVRGGAPAWYPRLRLYLTSGAILCLSAALLALLLAGRTA